MLVAQPGDLRHRGRVGARHGAVRARSRSPGSRPAFTGQIAVWLWFTVLFANFAEAIAEGRGGAQADACARTRTDDHGQAARRSEEPQRVSRRVSALDLRPGDIVLVEAGDVIPGDGEIIEGIASVNEAAITGESAPVIREAAATARPSPAAPPWSPTGSRCASPPRPAPPSSTA